MQLMPDERILLQSDTKEFTLTTHRIQYDTREWGRAWLTSIMLEELCSCEVKHVSHPWLFVLVGLSVVVGILGVEDYVRVIGFGLAFVFTFAYFLTRRGVISLASGGAAINLRTAGMSFDSAAKLVGQVEAAKNQRSLLLARR